MKDKMMYLLGYAVTAIYLIVPVIFFAVSVARADVPATWNATKNAASDEIYFDQTTTFYCGCEMTSHGDSDGSGDVDLTACGYVPAEKHAHRAERLEWEHVVPASLMPARQFDCWENGSRHECESTNQEARDMIFDLHNLVPSIGQVNALRGNDRYADLDDVSDFGTCMIEDAKGLFEPGKDERGDVARIWLYMNWKHGVVIPEDEMRTFVKWHNNDKVSDWEIERDKRIEAVQGNGNPWVTRTQ